MDHTWTWMVDRKGVAMWCMGWGYKIDLQIHWSFSTPDKRLFLKVEHRSTLINKLEIRSLIILSLKAGRQLELPLASASWGTPLSMEQLYEAITGKASYLYNKYSDLMDRRPVFTQCVTTSTFSLISDIISQTIEARTIGIPLSLDVIRFASFAIVGFIFDGPFFHFWYDLMWKFDDYLQTQQGFSKFSGTSAQVFVDQIIGSLIYFPIYFYVYDIIEAFISGKLPCLSLTGHKVRKELFAVIFVSYLVFPLSNFLNFYFIPKQFRIMFLNIVDLFFSAYQCSKVA